MDYFNKYKQAKICLYGMVGQFLNYYLDEEDALKYGIEYSKKNLEFRNWIDLCHHDFTEDGLLAWNYLGIEKPFITHEELWDRRSKINDEVLDDSVDYHQMYLKMSVLLIDMVIKNYKTEISVNEAKFKKIRCDYYEDEWKDMITVCHHKFESAGENVWNFLNITDEMVGRSVFEEKRNNFTEELLEIEYSKLNTSGDKVKCKKI